jgi:hypothetical protein
MTNDDNRFISFIISKHAAPLPGKMMEKEMKTGYTARLILNH